MCSSDLETSGREAPDEGRLAEIERSLGGIELAALQRECLRRSLEAGVFIMTGGPGTGKTTTVRSILAWCEMQGLKAELAKAEAVSDVEKRAFAYCASR